MSSAIRLRVQTSQPVKCSAARMKGYYGETMGNYKEPEIAGNRAGKDSNQEVELNSLRSLVCDLLKTNQELREALLEVRIGAVRSRGPE